ncbi:hypothetical protein AMAG_09003 [Allomyces macrogynus ATCC 38327]|uniref:NAD(+) diphosphatase n=1 Tax=Allomyces macrogynus (strain ATCC 38327) TaxID=578462 RepID=A0A0L0SNG2_ALLM3|nr:hypothetical protein AMAG_09003 [Allomyces macrogynus ATCC 38327]|eukprot:KNE63940.1 hypothetical protein AMAG_09003 [Allomyces macrogynus ATCC 38327]
MRAQLIRAPARQLAHPPLLFARSTLLPALVLARTSKPKIPTRSRHDATSAMAKPIITIPPLVDDPVPTAVPGPDLFENAAAGHADAVLAAVRQNPSLLTTRADPADATSATLLHVAARYGRARVARALVEECAADVCALQTGKHTPADVASFWGHDALAAYLRAHAEAAACALPDSRRWAAADTLADGDDAVPSLFASPLDRAAHLRDHADALGAMFRDPRTRYVAMCGLAPLVHAVQPGMVTDEPGAGVLYVLTRDDHVATLVGAQGDPALLPSWPTDGTTPPGLVFLGVDARDAGRAYFGVELLATPLAGAAPGTGAGWAPDAATVLEKLPGAKVGDMRAAALALLRARDLARDHSARSAVVTAANLLAQTRSVLDWHARHAYCAACGTRVRPGEAGYKQICTSGSSCLKGVQNFSYPRTDPVVMACVTSPCGTKVLVGRSKGWPAGMYSVVAGFVEPGESLEDAARREVVEETGVVVDPRPAGVRYVRSQPWPFPNSLMLGCMARAVSEEIVLRDGELEDAKWVDAATMRALVEKGDRKLGGGGVAAAAKDVKPTRSRPPSPSGSATKPGAGMFVPPASSLAGLLLREWVHHWAKTPKSRM